MELVKGNRLHDRFKVIGSLGTGHDGRVLLAHDASWGDRLIALKVFRSEETGWDRLKFDKVRTLHHENLVKPLEFIDERGFRALAMEYVEGDELSAYLEKNPLSSEAAAKLLIQLATAAEMLHANGIVHGNIKPANIFITADNVLKLNDAAQRPESGESGVSAELFRAGSAHYAAPEFLRFGRCDELGDVYSIGVVGREILDSVNDKTTVRKKLSRAIERAATPDHRDRSSLIAFKAAVEESLVPSSIFETLSGYLFIAGLAIFMLAVAYALDSATNFFSA